jgi:hypothetical protein
LDVKEEQGARLREEVTTMEKLRPWYNVRLW